MAVKTFFCKLLPPSDARRLTANDPVIRADRGFKYEMFLMPRGAVHPPTGAA